MSEQLHLEAMRVCVTTMMMMMMMMLGPAVFYYQTIHAMQYWATEGGSSDQKTKTINSTAWFRVSYPGLYQAALGFFIAMHP